MWNALKPHMECTSLWSAGQLNDIDESGESRTQDVATLLIAVRRHKLIFGTPMGPVMIIQNIGRFILQRHRAVNTPGGGKNRNTHKHTHKVTPSCFFYSGTHLALFSPNQPFCKRQRRRRRRLWGGNVWCQSVSQAVSQPIWIRMEIAQ